MSLGKSLRSARTEVGWSLREVEKRTKGKISNGYLSLLEADQIKNPSPHILYTLAKVYGRPYSTLMTLAGYIMPDKESSIEAVAFAGQEELTNEERQAVQQLIQHFRKSKGSR